MEEKKKEEKYVSFVNEMQKVQQVVGELRTEMDELKRKY